MYRTFLASFKSHKIALLLIVALMGWALGLPSLNTATAAAITSAKDLITDSDISALTNHHIVFTTPNGSAANDSTVTVTFAAGFNLGSVAEDDIDVLRNGTQLTTAANCAGTENLGVAAAGQVITLTICSGDGGQLASSTVVEVKIGTIATSSGSGANRIQNPGSAGSQLVTIAGTGQFQDSGQLRVAIIDDVIVTAAVDTTLTFTISAVNANSTINGTATTTSTSTATTVPFGTIAVGTSYRVAQNLSVTTNAANGFVVTVFADQNLTSGAGSDIDDFIDGVGTAVPAAWQAPAGTFGSEDTYGHWGITSEDADLNGDEFGTALYAGNFINNARQVFSHTGAADGSTANSGSTRVGYQIQISSLQEAGNDYTATLTYVATPTF